MCILLRHCRIRRPALNKPNIFIFCVTWKEKVGKEMNLLWKKTLLWRTNRPFHSGFKRIINLTYNLLPNSSEKELNELNSKVETLILKQKGLKREIQFLRQTRDLLTGLNYFKALFNKDLRYLKNLNTLSLFYYLEKVETEKTFSWKRRIHFFSKRLTEPEINSLVHDLILSNFAYFEDFKTKDDVKLENGLRSALQALQDNPPVKDKKSRLRKYMESVTQTYPSNISVENKNSNLTESQWVWKNLQAEREGTVSRPAHYSGILENTETKEKVVHIVIRGTYTLDDLLTNNIMVFKNFNKGQAHEGFLTSAEYLYDKYFPILTEIYEHLTSTSSDSDNLQKDKGPEESKKWNLDFLRKDKQRDKKKSNRLKIKIIGHSSGGAVGSLLAFLLKNSLSSCLFDIKCITFGCPPTISKELLKESEETNFITSVINDDDLVPRLTDINIKILANDLFSFDYNSYLERDINAFLKYYNRIPISKQTIKTLVHKTFSSSSLPLTKERREVVVEEKSSLGNVGYVPGNIIHIFRTGRGYQCCKIKRILEEYENNNIHNKETKERERERDIDSNFVLLNQIIYSRTMIDDHLVHNYYNALIESKS